MTSIPQEYIKSSMFTNTEVELIMAFRSYTVRSFRMCFPSMYGDTNLNCPFKCLLKNDSPEHLLLCPQLLSKLDEKDLIEARNVQFSFLFGSIFEQKLVIQVIMKLLDIRNTMITYQWVSTGCCSSGTEVDFLNLLFSFYAKYIIKFN